MRHVIVHESLLENEARPPGAFAHLVERCTASARKLLEGRAHMDALLDCPACGSTKTGGGVREARLRLSQLRRLPVALDLASSHRRPVRWYLHESPAAQFRCDPEYLRSIETRMRDVALPRADQLESLAGQVPGSGWIIQVGPRNPMVLAQLHRRGMGPLACVNPLPPYQSMSGPEVTTHADLTPIPAGSARIVALLDILEHERDVVGLLAEAHRVLVPGGFLVVTARSGSGFDVQVLWEHADVSPLEHLNLISVEGMRTLLDRSGFRIVEFSTPGQLDVQVVWRMRNERGVVLPRFLEYLLSHRDAACHERFQDFIQEQRLSSHMRLIARSARADRSRGDSSRPFDPADGVARGHPMPTQNDSTMTVIPESMSPVSVVSPGQGQGGARRQRRSDPRRDRRAREGRRPPCRLRPAPSRDGAPRRLRHQPAAGREVARRRFTTDYRDLVGGDLDAVFVCTYNNSAPDVVVAALEAGKHVFCEKPPGRCVADVERIIAAERASRGRKLKFGFNHRHHGSVMEAKQIVDSGRYGRVLWLRGVYGKCGSIQFENDWRNDRNIAGGGILLDQGIHMLDLCRFFCGDFDQVKSLVNTAYWKIPFEDNAFAILSNAAGQVAMVHSSATQWKHQFSLEICLEDGYVHLHGILSSTRSYGDERLTFARKQLEDTTRAFGRPREETIIFDTDDSWSLEVADFAEAIRQDRAITSGNSHDALRAMQLIEAVYENGVVR